MSNLTILTETEQTNFDYPPVLPPEIKSACFSITPEVENKIQRLQTSTNKVGFLLQYGYFKACKRFFLTHRFRQEDIEYAARLLNIPLHSVNMSQYKKKIPADHKNSILELLNYKNFDGSMMIWLRKEIKGKVECFAEPQKIFIEILQLLSDQHIEIPSYHRLSELITQGYLDYESKMLVLIQNHLSAAAKEKLDELLIAGTDQTASLLNQFKYINQSLKPKPIKASLNLLSVIYDYFINLLPIIDILKMTPSICGYYATWVKKAKLSQLKQFPEKEKMYLHLIAFIQHQFYLRQDACVDILLKCVQSTKNSVVKKLNKIDQLSRSERKAAAKYLTKSNHNYHNLIDEITNITKSRILSDKGKVEKIHTLLDTHAKKQKEKEKAKIALFEKSLDRIAHDQDYFDVLTELSVKLQLRLTGIVNAIVFNAEMSNKLLIEAIEHFKQKDGDINRNAPQNFLDQNEKAALRKRNGTQSADFNVSLYKILLFLHIADAIKSGELNSKYSYQYLSIDEYLVDRTNWNAQRDELLNSVKLSSFSNCMAVLNLLKLQLDEKYQTVNQRILDGKNPYLFIDKKGKVRVTTPPLATKETEFIADLLKQRGYVPVLQILNEINDITSFSQCLKHHSIKHVKGRPNTDSFMAGIIGLGCNIGVSKMAQISRGVNEHTLQNTVNWYFSYKTLYDANQCIVDAINRLALSSIFIEEKSKLHSSSDGQKVNVAVESLIANFSFKYFGKEKGVSVYTFIDERQALFYYLVMSASEREAAYVIDGIHNNNVTKINIHSTDTHGYSEMIFCITHFIDIAFAPRIKNIKKQNIYGFSSRKTYEQLGYKVLPSRTINQKLIIDNWEDILRFIVTIKLKNVTASQLLKRLSSYARSNPLYKALKEFGRIIKSIYILTYFDDVKLRQRIQKQLNRIELSNKFSNAVFYANDGEFKQATHEDQEISTGCKILIQNAIVLWNYLYLSQLLVNCQDETERIQILSMIKNGSVITWRHINLHGEFDFIRPAVNDSFFDMAKIWALQVA